MPACPPTHPPTHPSIHPPTAVVVAIKGDEVLVPGIGSKQALAVVLVHKGVLRGVPCSSGGSNGGGIGGAAEGGACSTCADHILVWPQSTRFLSAAPTKERGDEAAADTVQRRHPVHTKPRPLLHAALQHRQRHLHPGQGSRIGRRQSAGIAQPGDSPRWQAPAPAKPDSHTSQPRSARYACLEERLGYAQLLVGGQLQHQVHQPREGAVQHHACH